MYTILAYEWTLLSLSDIDKLAIYQTNSKTTNEERSVRNVPRRCNKRTEKNIVEIWSIEMTFYMFDW